MKTFEAGKTISELGIDTTRKFVVVDGSSFFQKGDILKLFKDDETSVPYFENEYGKQTCIHLDRLAYYEEEMKEGDLVYVSYVSEEDALYYKCERILLRKCSDGVVCINLHYENEYRDGKCFKTNTWNYVVPIPQTKTITLEVTDEQERKINLLLKK